VISCGILEKEIFCEEKMQNKGQDARSERCFVFMKQGLGGRVKLLEGEPLKGARKITRAPISRHQFDG